MARGTAIIIPRSIQATPYGNFRLLQRFEGRLLSTGKDLGATLIGIEDSAGNFSSDNVEDALAEIVTDVSGYDIKDTNIYYTTDTIDGAFDALALQVGGDTDATFAFTYGYVLTDDIAVYEALDLIDTSLGQLLPSQKYTFWDDFDRQDLDTTNGPWLFYEGTDAITVDYAIDGTVQGVLTLTTGDDAAGTFAANGAEVVAVGAPIAAQDGGLIIEFYLNIDDITATGIQFGLTDNAGGLEQAFQIDATDNVTATAADAVCFVYDTTAATDEWFAAAVDSTVVDTQSSVVGVAPVNGVNARFVISIGNTGEDIVFAIDGTTVATFTGDAGVSPDVTLYPYVAGYSTGAASRNISVDYTVMRCTRN